MKIRSANVPEYDVEAAKESNSLGVKIEEARQALKISQEEVSKRLSAYGVTTGLTAISKWEKGVTVPNAHQLIALCYVLGIVDVLGYFGKPALSREGFRKLREYKQDLIASGRYEPDDMDSEIRYIDMPVSLLPVAAGVGEYLDSDAFEMVSYPQSSVPQGAEFGVRVSGDSMEPVYHDGQIVWVQRCDSLRTGEVGVFVYGGKGYLKEYREQAPNVADVDAFAYGDGRVRAQAVLVSYNKQYGLIPVSPEEYFKIVGRVLR